MSRFARRRRARVIRAIRSAEDEPAALAAIRREIEPNLAEVTRAEDREPLYRSIRALLQTATPVPMGMGREDWLSALAVFVLVSATALPAVLPFLLVRDPHLALRISNWLLVALLFGVGFRWARYVDLNPWRAGLVLASIGVALVGVAIALGG